MAENEEIVVPQMNSDNPPPSTPPKNTEPTKKEKRVGGMVTGIVMFAVALIFTAITAFYILYIFMQEDKTSAVVAFILYIFTFGWVTFLPALACSIVGIVMSAISIQSCKKGVKVTCIIFLILNILVLLSVLVLAFVALIMPQSLAST